MKKITLKVVARVVATVTFLAFGFAYALNLIPWLSGNPQVPEETVTTTSVPTQTQAPSPTPQREATNVECTKAGYLKEITLREDAYVVVGETRVYWHKLSFGDDGELYNYTKDDVYLGAAATDIDLGDGALVGDVVSNAAYDDYYVFYLCAFTEPYDDAVFRVWDVTTLKESVWPTPIPTKTPVMVLP